MFQSVGHNVIETIAQALDVPLVRMQTSFTSIERGIDYTEKKEGDEVEDLFALLSKVKV